MSFPRVLQLGNDKVKEGAPPKVWAGSADLVNPAKRANRAERSLAIGNFDGIHQGHRVLLQRMRAQAPELIPTVLSFHPHPLELLTRTNPNLRAPPAPILGVCEKLRRLAGEGVEEVVLQAFTAEFSNWSPEYFVRELLVARLRVKHVCVGENFRFGHKRAGDVTLLQHLGASLGEASGFQVDIAPLVQQNGAIVSSGRIRSALWQGDLKSAQDLLGEAYSVTGRVIHGAKLGRTLNIPTLNLKMPVNSQGQAVLSGVFVVRVHGLATATATALPAIASVGTRPTVEIAGQVLLEVHVFDFQQECYGARVRVEFLHKLRDEVRFESLLDLSLQMQHDLAAAREFHQAKTS